MIRRCLHLVLLAALCVPIWMNTPAVWADKHALKPARQELNASDFVRATDERTFESSIQLTPVPFTYMMLRWDGAPATLELLVRTSEDEAAWTPWTVVAENGDLQDGDAPDSHWSDAIDTGLARYWQVRVRIVDGVDDQSSLPTQVVVDTVDVQGGDATPDFSIAALPTGGNPARPPFVARGNWGGETVRRNSSAPQWRLANHLIVHESADANTLSGREGNWAGRVRAIWAFHRYTRGWGDIGYNWVIDPNGVIYEGRNGSADLDRDSVGIHDTANYGSMSVVLLGTFGAGGPHAPIVPSAAAQAALVRLLAWKAGQRGIDPLGSSVYSGCLQSSHCASAHPGGVVENIAGHRDVTPGYTSCPGDLAENLLSSIRQRTRDTLAAAKSGDSTSGPIEMTPSAEIAASPTMIPSPTMTPPPTATSTPSPTSTPAPTPTPRPTKRLAASTHWTVADSPVVLVEDLAIPDGIILSIDPGVEVRLGPGIEIHVVGQLNAAGTPDAPVRFVGNDGRWGALVGEAGGTMSLANAELQDAGSDGAAIRSSSGVLRLDAVQVAASGGGIFADGSMVEVLDSHIENNDLGNSPALAFTLAAERSMTLRGNSVAGNHATLGTPLVRIVGASAKNTPFSIEGNSLRGERGRLLEMHTGVPLAGTVRCNSFDGGAVGLQLSATTPGSVGYEMDIIDNAFEGQTSYGVASTVALDAAGNWWGAPSGPGDVQRNPQGKGVRVGVNVGFEPPLDSRPACVPRVEAN